jgi:peptidoglycan/LPS O-acetylase OafA/YrhL
MGRGRSVDDSSRNGAVSGQPRLADHVPALDGLRGIAILWVMYYHFANRDGALTSTAARAFIAIGQLGWAGVDLFFVLSGFLITKILLRARGKPSYFRDFYMRRVLRIFPLYYGTLFVVFCLIPHIFPIHDPEVLRVYRDQIWLFTYSSNVVNAIRGDFAFSAGWLSLNHFWTLCVEEHFYLVWPALVFFLSRKVLLRTSIAIIVLVPVFRTACVLSHVEPSTILSFTPCRLDSLALGGLIAILASDEVQLRSMIRMAPLALGASIVVLIIVWLFRSNSLSLCPPMQTVGYSALGTASGALLVLAVAPGDNLLKRALQNRALMGLGKYSYGAYVLHLLIRPTLVRWFSPERIASASGSQLVGVVGHAALCIGFAIGTAMLSWHAYEKHFLGMKKHFDYGATLPSPAYTDRLGEPIIDYLALEQGTTSPKVPGEDALGQETISEAAEGKR